jgi:hypothetical protein
MRRLVVDCYACQHLRYIAKGRSLAAHLTGLAVAIEHPTEPQLLNILQRWISRTRDIPMPSVPDARGDVTIADVIPAPPEEHAAAVGRWAQSVWIAWGEHHALARKWIAAARG